MEIPKPYSEAVTTALDSLRTEFQENYLGALAGGSVAKGTQGPNSDIDVYILVNQTWRQRRTRLINGIEVELFINPVEQISNRLPVNQAAK